MVSFQCEGCGDVFTKKKLDAHYQRCYNAAFTCLDCMTTFTGQRYRSHTSCISEAQKYEGSMYKTPKARQETSRQSASTTGKEVARVNAPPRAPSPPNAHTTSTPAHVVDYLAAEQSPSTTTTTPAESDAPDRPQSEGGDEAKRRSVSPFSPRGPSNMDLDCSSGFTYGSGPVPKTMQRFESDLSRSGLAGMVTETRTPGAPRLDDYSQESLEASESRSEKKRKRGQAEDHEVDSLVNGTKQRGLHSGLTGGLSKLLDRNQAHTEESSPLNPKKRAKQNQVISSGADHRGKDWKRDDMNEDTAHDSRSNQEASQTGENNTSGQLVRRKPQKVVKYGVSHTVQSMEGRPTRKLSQSNSSFFLSLVDKPHSSIKGQSVWGTLKTFHEGVCTEINDEDYRESGIRDREEKRLFKGLRMKVNQDGDVIIFARGDRERSASPEAI